MSNDSPDLATRIVAALTATGLIIDAYDEEDASVDITRAVLAESKDATDEKKAERIIDSLDEVDLLIEPFNALDARRVVLSVLDSRAGVALDNPPGLAHGQQGIPVDVFALSVEGRYVAWCVGRRDAENLQDLNGPERCIIDRATIVSVDQDTPRAPDAIDPDLQRVQDQINALAAERLSAVMAAAESSPGAGQVWRADAEAYADEVLASTGSVRGMVSTEAARHDLVDAYVAGAKGRAERFREAAQRTLDQHRGTFERLAEVERTERPVVLSDADRLLLAEACRRAEGESYGHDPAEESKREEWLRLAKVLGG